MKIVVNVYEYERGWGQRLFTSREFDMSEFGMRRAQKYQRDINSENTNVEVPDVYYRAEKPRIVE